MLWRPQLDGDLIRMARGVLLAATLALRGVESRTQSRMEGTEWTINEVLAHRELCSFREGATVCAINSPPGLPYLRESSS